MGNPKQITALGQLGEVKVSFLKQSGDKEITIKIKVVGKEVDEAAKFGSLPEGTSVLVTYDPDIQLIS